MMTRQKGFTLAELLIALALLGIIAAFTIPKVLQATGNQEATAKVREAVSTLEQAWYNLKMQNQVPNGAAIFLYDAIAGNMNTVNQSNTTVSAAGTPAGPLPATHPCVAAAPNGWVQFANGVVISGLSSGPAFTNATAAQLAGPLNNYLICVDYNGSANPNIAGTDVFVGTFNQFGDFDGAAALFAPTDTGRNFFWGNGNQTVYAINNGAVAAPFNTATASAGSRLAT